MDIVTKKVDELIPYFQNPRVISEQAVNEVAKSFNNHGIQQVICIDENNVIVAGHTRLLAAKKLGLTEMPCTIYKGKPESINAYRLADNKVAEYSQWEQDFLDKELSQLKEMNMEVAGFTFDDSESFVESLDDMIDDDVSVDSVGYSASELTNQVPLMFYFETEERDEVMNLLEKIRDDKELQTKSNAFLYLVRNYK
jgi:site-specific DNA-methyltransferase (adenine-specific)